MAHAHSLSTDYNRRFLIGTLLNSLLVVAQIVYGIKANSVALISDGFHNAGDVLGLLIAWGGFYLSQLKSSEKFTFGLKRATILAAFINAVLLFIAVGGISWEAIMRLKAPEAIDIKVVFVMALVGVLINGTTAMLFFSKKSDLNLRGAFLHLFLDAAVSLGVVLASIGIFYTGWLWLDPALSLLISLLIVISSWGLFRESINLILHAVPEHIDLLEVRKFLLQQQGVQAVHDLHVWALSTLETALSAHLVLPQSEWRNGLIADLSEKLKYQFHIDHSTIQLETEESAQKCQTAC